MENEQAEVKAEAGDGFQPAHKWDREGSPQISVWRNGRVAFNRHAVRRWNLRQYRLALVAFHEGRRELRLTLFPAGAKPIQDDGPETESAVYIINRKSKISEDLTLALASPLGNWGVEAGRYAMFRMEGKAENVYYVDCATRLGVEE